jgi:hypothetical protein
METYAVSDKLSVALWGASISADGIYAIAAAVVIVVAVLATRRA